MFKNLKFYLKDRLDFIIIYFFSVIITLVVNNLYKISNKGVKYSIVLSGLLIFIMGLKDYFNYNYNINYLERIDSGYDDIKTKKDSKIEKEYQKIIYNLEKEIKDINNKNLEEKNKLYEDYVIWIHQIKTPISAISMIFNELEGEIRQDLKHELFRIDRYTDMALNNIRLQSISEDLDIREYNLEDLVKKVLKEYYIQFNYKNNKLILKDFNKKIITDKKWFMFIFEQILSNAIKYTNNGEITIGVENYRLYIKDTGIGIREEDINRLFSRGFTGFTGREMRKATGLGLYMSKKIANSLGHTLEIKSEVGKGTTVYIGIDSNNILKD